MRVVVAAAISVLAVEGAVAQTSQQPPAEPPAEVIVVTALGPARSGDELIANTTLLDEADLAERLNGGLGDTLAGLPGISSTAFGPGASRPIIRGLGAERVQVLNNGIGVIDASAASPDHAVTADPLGAQRVEILRGPAALAYGGGASGGVINVIDGLIAEQPIKGGASGKGYAGYTSVDEGTTLAAQGAASAGPATLVLSASRRDANALSIPGFAESARLHAAEEEEHGHDEGDGEEEHEHEHEEEAHAYGELPNSQSFTDALSAGLSFSGDAGFVGVAIRKLDSRYGIVGGHEHHEEEEEGAEHAEEDHAHEAENPFIELEQTRLDIRGGVNFEGGPFERFTASVSGVDYQHTEFEAPGVAGTVFNSNGVEARAELEHVHHAGFGGTLGVQASRRRFEALGDEAFISPTTTEQAGAFIFETWDSGVWGLEGGLRIDSVRIDNALAGERSFEPVNASIGVHGHLTENLFLGASLSRTERAPTDVELFADGQHIATRQYEIGDSELDTEKGITLDLSARWDAGPLTLGASVYRYQFDDFIYLNPTGEEADELPVFRATQADAHFTGAEVTAGMDFGSLLGVAWRADASADIVRAELDGGGDLPRIPPASATASLEGEISRFTGKLEVRWAAEQDRVTDYELPTDGYTALDFGVTTRLVDGVDLILEGTNLTDEEIRVHASPLKDLAPQAGRGFRAAIRASF
jgi:iron complex outermembrane receptor protein